MKTSFKFGIALVTGAALGASAVQGLHAQAKPPVYLVSEIDVIDEVAFRQYSPLAGKALNDAGAKYLARGSTVVPINGEPPKRAVIVMFESMEQAQAWRNAPASNELAPLRDKAIEVVPVV
jgi:uncharacterized protein (DUF1330 family)